MGWNTTVVVMNDSLGAIKEDPKFGEKLVAAIQKVSAFGKQEDVSAGGHVNAATVVESHHADFHVLVRIGHNYGTEVGIREDAGSKHTELVILEEYANRLGYTLHKKRKRKGQ